MSGSSTRAGPRPATITSTPDGTLFEHFGTDVQPADLADREVVVILDLSAWSQLGDMAGWVREFTGPRVVIDHHVSQDDLGAIFLKDTTAEATGTLVARAIHALGGTFTREVATGLLTAIAMDTGWFRHPNTKAPRRSGPRPSWSSAGAEIDEVYRLLFERSTLGRLKLMGETLAGLQTDAAGRIAYASVTRDDIERTGAIPPGHRGPGRLHRQHRRRRGGPAVHRAGAGRDQAERPVAQRHGLLPPGRPLRRRRPPRGGGRLAARSALRERRACPRRGPERARPGAEPAAA